MARARLYEVIQDAAGNRVANASVTLRTPGTSNPIADTLYAADTGATTLTNPLTSDASGVVECYLDAAQRVDLRVTAAGMTAVTLANVPVLLDRAVIVTLTGAQTLTNKTLSSPTISSPTVSGGTFSEPTFSGGLDLPAGAVNDLSLRSASDSGSGAYFPATGQVALVAESEALIVKRHSAGRMGFIAPSSGLGLDQSTSGDATLLALLRNGTVGGLLKLDSRGRLIIAGPNQTSPAVVLDASDNWQFNPTPKPSLSPQVRHRFGDDAWIEGVLRVGSRAAYIRYFGYLTADEAAGQTVLSVDSASSLIDSEMVHVLLTDGTLHEAAISSRDTVGGTITVASAIPTGKTGAEGVTTNVSAQSGDGRTLTVADGSEFLSNDFVTVTLDVGTHRTDVLDATSSSVTLVQGVPAGRTAVSVRRHTLFAIKTVDPDGGGQFGRDIAAQAHPLTQYVRRGTELARMGLDASDNLTLFQGATNTEALTVAKDSGVVRTHHGQRNIGTVITRIEATDDGTSAALPSAATGVGIELGVLSGSTSLIRSVNRTSSAVAPLEFRGSSFKLGTSSSTFSQINFYSVAHDTASIAANDIANIDVTVTGVAAGDIVIPHGIEDLENHLIIQSAWAAGANTVRMRVMNKNGSAVDAASRTFKFVVIRP